MINAKETIIRDGNLVAKVFHRKMGSYRYKSPRYGYKVGYRATLDIYVYEKGNPDHIANLKAKGALRSEIKNYMRAIQLVLDTIRHPVGANLVQMHRSIKELGIKKSAIK